MKIAEHRGHPVQVALGDHRDDALAAQPAGQQGAGQPVGPGVELAIGASGELNARANRLARALLARGLGREEVVAVVTERNLDWLAAVLAIFKAGGVYLPIEPHFPAGRIAATLTRADCAVVVAKPAAPAPAGCRVGVRPSSAC